MSDQAYAPRYNTLSPELVAERGLEAAKASPTNEKRSERFDAFHRVLTWSILSVCLAVWAVVGFVFWVPLMLRSMFRFTFALGGSMLAGQEPVEAGRILRDTVSFYRRGFTVAIGAVFGDVIEEKKKSNRKPVRMSSRNLFFEVMWSAVFWYVALLFMGVALPSPVEGWVALAEFPWGSELRMLLDRALTSVGL